MKLYTNEAVKNLLKLYEEKGGQIIVRQWCLLDEYLCYWEGLKSTVILDKYLNERSSAYTIRMFKKLPKKYEDYFFNQDF